LPAEPTPELSALESRVRQLMWDNAGLVRSAQGLRRALDGIDAVESRMPAGAGQLRNLATVARLITRAALIRTESRGAHFRTDHPETEAKWRRRLVLSLQGADVQIGFEPLPIPAASSEEVSA
jgi:L-aspartate oxidase